MNPEISKIMGVVQRAVSKTNEGEGSLTSNLAELCKEAAFNDEEIKRSVEWANTLTQLKLFKSGADKTDEFDLADAKEVRGKIFNVPEDVEKEASYLTRYPDLYKSLQKKAAYYTPVKTKNTLSDYPQSEHELAKEAFTKVAELKTQHQHAQEELDLAEDRFFQGMFKIASNLSNLYSEKFSEFEQLARDTIGNKCEPYLHTLEKMAGANNKRLLNYTPKKIIKGSENVQLLKEAMANCELTAVFKSVTNRTREAIESCDERLTSYAKTRFNSSI